MTLTIHGRAASLTFPGRVFLAPMDGITDASFRDLVIACGGVHGAITEFIRISVAPQPRRVMRRHLGTPQAVPVGIQLMAADPEHLVRTISNAEAVGAPWIDLNFGCPAPVVFNKCAGSGLLAHPDRLAAIAATAVTAARVPVSAKLRCGITSPDRVEELVLTLADAGVAMITLHGRLRAQGYHQPATWTWIARAVQALRGRGHHIPLIGNGSIEQPEDIARLLTETGCDGVMVGRAALADPYLFRVAAGGPPPTRAEAVGFCRDYIAAISRDKAPAAALCKIKQQARWYRCAGILDGREDARAGILQAPDLATVHGWLDRLE